MWREIWYFIWLEWRRWWEESETGLCKRVVTQIPKGRVFIYLAFFFSTLLFFGFFSWFFSFVNLFLTLDDFAWIIFFLLLFVFFLPFLKSFPDFTDSEEYRFLQTFPHAAATRLLSKLIVDRWEIGFLSAALLGAAGVALTVTERGSLALVSVWWLYQVAATGISLFLRVVVNWGYVKVELWKVGRKRSKFTIGFWTGLAKLFVWSAFYFAGGMIAFHLIRWMWQVVETGWCWKELQPVLPSQLKTALIAILFHPSAAVIGFTVLVLIAAVVTLPSLVRFLEQDRAALKDRLEARVLNYEPYLFHGEGIMLIMEKDLLHFLRVPRSQAALSALSVAFFLSGMLVELARFYSLGRYPWGLLLLSLIGSYAVCFFGQDLVCQITGPAAEGDQFNLYRLTPFPYEAVIWGKVLLSTGLMTTATFVFGVALIGLSEVTKIWVPAIILVNIAVPLVEAVAHAGIPAFFALRGQGVNQDWDRLQLRVIANVISVGYYLLLFGLLGVPSVYSIYAKEMMVPRVEWAYAFILLPVLLLVGVMKWWWQSWFGRR
ncbi:MAG: hypothetical protein PWQ31_1090 [Eubacteriales bacterium]|nr:hypothetical protein [Eubacteriales bacterium]